MFYTEGCLCTTELINDLFLLENTYQHKLILSSRNEREMESRWVVDTKPPQHLAVIASANCSICHGKGAQV